MRVLLPRPLAASPASSPSPMPRLNTPGLRAQHPHRRYAACHQDCLASSAPAVPSHPRASAAEQRTQRMSSHLNTKCLQLISLRKRSFCFLFIFCHSAHAVISQATNQELEDHISKLNQWFWMNSAPRLHTLAEGKRT